MKRTIYVVTVIKPLATLLNLGWQTRQSATNGRRWGCASGRFLRLLSRAATGLSQPGRRNGSRGFTLIEVLVALSITLIAVAVVSEAVSGVLRTARDTARWDHAVSRAQSRLAAVINPETILGERQGDEGDGYHWRTDVSFIGSAPAPNPARGGVWAHGTGLYAVTVVISWHDGRTPQRFVLRSARLGPVLSGGP